MGHHRQPRRASHRGAEVLHRHTVIGEGGAELLQGDLPRGAQGVERSQDGIMLQIRGHYLAALWGKPLDGKVQRLRGVLGQHYLFRQSAELLCQKHPATVQNLVGVFGEGMASS